jgi:transcriptional regulator GlxA family with amidase domain
MATRFVFLLLPHIHILDLAGPDQAIHEAIDYGADFSIEYCGIDESIVTTSGLPFGKVQHFTKAKLKKGDFLVIPGADFTYLTSPRFLEQKGLFQWIDTNYNKGINICSICIGAFVLAETDC